MSMADLLAKTETTNLKLERNQEIQGVVVFVGDKDVILDLGSKAEGVLSAKDFTDEKLASLKEGDRVSAFVIRTENESGQVVLGLNKPVPVGKSGGHTRNWDKFITAKNKAQVLRGKATELNKGGLIVEVDGVRGFIPSSQVTLSQAAKIDDLVGQELQVTVIEIDPGQNRLIFSQKTVVSEETKAKLGKLKHGDKVKGKAAAILPFGVFVNLEDSLEGLVHVSEISWEKVEDPALVVKIGEEIEAVVTNVDLATGRVNLSIKQLSDDPFAKIAEKFQPEDVISGTVTKVSSAGVSLELESGVEGLIASGKIEAGTDYPIGKKVTCLVDSVDVPKRRVNLVPFVTSTKDLIYK